MNKKKIGWYFIFIVQCLLTIPTILGLLSPVISPTTFYWPALCALLLPFLMLTQICFFIYWLVKWDWPALIALFVIVVGIPAIDRMIQIGYKAEVQDRAALQVLSFNAHNLRGLHKKSEEGYNAALEKWKEYSRSLDDFDIVCFQDYNNFAEKFIEKLDAYPYTIECDKRHSIRLYSKFPIVNSGCIDLIEHRINQAIWADILLPKGKSKKYSQDTLRVYNVHLASNQISKISRKMAKNKTINPENIYHKTRRMFSLYKDHAPIRIREIKRVLEHSLKSDKPMLICGDFNETPQSRVYRLVTDRFDDAFIQAGSGMGTTYGGYIPFLRIDYIFYSDAVKVISYNRGDEIEFSDHYPISASIVIKDPQKAD